MMTSPEVRHQVVIDIELAVSAGARQHVACAMVVGAGAGSYLSGYYA